MHGSGVPDTVLVICHGNLCRSPMAEGLLRERLSADWRVASAGTHALGGDPPSPLGREAMLREFGIDIEAQRSSPLTVSEMNGAAHVLTMSVRQALLAAALGDATRVRLLGAFAPASPTLGSAGSADPGGESARPVEIADPMGGTYEEYRVCLARLRECTDAFADWLEQGAPVSTGPPAVGSGEWRLQIG